MMIASYIQYLVDTSECSGGRDDVRIGMAMFANVKYADKV